jgi:hypothetical protein
VAGVKIDGGAVLRGMAVAAVVAVPVGVFGRAPVWAVVVLAALVVGAVVAASSQHVGFPLVHGILAAVGLYVIVQGLGIIVRSARGEDLHWARYASSLLLSVAAGTLGGLIGGRRTEAREGQ